MDKWSLYLCLFRRGRVTVLVVVLLDLPGCELPVEETLLLGSTGQLASSGLRRTLAVVGVGLCSSNRQIIDRSEHRQSNEHTAAEAGDDVMLYDAIWL